MVRPALVLFLSLACSGQQTGGVRGITPNDIGYRLGSIEAKIDNLTKLADSGSRRLDETGTEVAAIRKDLASQKTLIEKVNDRIAVVWALLGFLAAAGLAFIGKQLFNRTKEDPVMAVDLELARYRMERLVEEHPESREDPVLRQAIDDLRQRTRTGAAR